jgi:hypothetical protein
MWVFTRHPWLLAWALLLVAAPARAWVETAVESDVATVDVARDGNATVRHELLLRIRGGPLRQYALEGVDTDAEPLPDATVTTVASGSDAAPIPLRLERLDDSSLRIEVDHPKGLRRGTYLFAFGYRTKFLARDLLTSRGGGWVELRWVGPRFVDGIDSLRVVFRLPRGPEAPFVPEVDAEANVPADEAFAGLFLSNLRRAGAVDELDVVRPHAAKGEPVVWRAMLSSQSFDAFAAAPTRLPAAAPVSPRQPAWAFALAGAFALALAYALLVTLKARAHAAACALRHAQPRPLVPLPLALRATAAGTLLATAAGTAWLAERPMAAALAFALSVAFAAHRPPRPLPRLRAPGHWLPLQREEAFGRPRARLPGRWLDATALPGAATALLVFSALGVAAVLLWARSVDAALLVWMAMGSLVPIFATAGRWSLPPDAAEAPRRLLSWLAGRLDKDSLVRVTAWGRIPDGASAPDELRLLVLPRRAQHGLLGIEVALEYGFGAAGPVAMPCVLVRAAEGSASHAALPREVVWTRGRKPEERVALLRPEPGTRRACLALLRELLRALTGPAYHKRPAKSAGSGSSIAKPASVASPAHAT